MGSQSNAVYKEFVFDPSDVVTLIHGKHILHFGGEFLISRADSTAWGNIDAGDVTFNGSYTSINGQTSVNPAKPVRPMSPASVMPTSCSGSRRAGEPASRRSSAHARRARSSSCRTTSNSRQS